MVADKGPILLSIAIPTKNRQSYLVNLVDELLRSDRQDFEIVIQDNSDDDQLAAYVAGLNDARVHYAYFGEWISVVDNCDAAIRACSGEYVCMLGDDDGLLLEESLAALADALREDADALVPAVLSYNWPDLSHHSIGGLSGKLYLRASDPGRRKFARDLRRVVARSGAMGLEGIPCVYHGFVRLKVLRELEQKTGSNFPGPSPDMANAIGIGTIIKNCKFTSTPLVITGHSRRSAGGQGMMKKHRGAISAQTHLPADTSAKWYPDIPFFWSGPTIYAQSLRSALQRTGEAGLGKPRDACLYTSCFIFEPDFRQETWRALRQSGNSLWVLAPQMAYYAAVITLKRAVNYKNNLLVRFFPEKASIQAESIAHAINSFRALQR